MMAEATIRGILSKDVIPASKISVVDPSEERCKTLSSLDIHTTFKSSEMLSRSEVIFIAVKPDIVPEVLNDIYTFEKHGAGKSPKMFISICAGVTLDTLVKGNPDRHVARVMPNQPCVVGEAASSFCLSQACISEDRNRVQLLLNACGTVVEVPEKSMDAVTGLSGSGPAFVFMMIEAMTDAGVKNGLFRPVAKRLAAQTVFGAAKMVLDDIDVHPAEMRNRVESPGGTTISGTVALEAHGFRSAVIEAVSAAVQRSSELGKK